MSVLVQYLKFLKSSPAGNEKKEKTAALPGYEPQVTGEMPNKKKDEGELTAPITEHGLAKQETPKNINTFATKPVAMRSESSAAVPAFTQPVANPGRGYNTGVPQPQAQQQPTKIPRVLARIPMANSVTDPKSGTLLDKQGSLGYSRNTGISDVEGEIYVNSNDVELLGKLGFEYSEGEYLGLEKTSEVLDVYSYIEKVAGVPKEVAKLIDDKKAFSAEYLKDMGYSVPKGYEVKGDLVCPVEKTEESSKQTGKEEKGSSEKTAAANPAQTILITGHSGSGKTTLSRQLAEKLGIPVRRVDAHRGWDNYIRGDDKRWKETLTPGTKEHSYFTNLVNRATRDTLKNAPTVGIIEGTQLGHLSPEELAKFKAHIVVGGTRDQSIAQRIQRSVDKASKQGITFSPEEMAAKKIKAEYVANFWEPGVEKFRKLPGVLNYNHSEHQIDPLVEQLKQFMGKQAASAAWQRSEGKNPAGGLNAKGRASYKKETGGTLKAPVTESEPKGERAKRQNSFCSRMCGMKSKNTGSKAQNDPDSRINKALSKWNCKCGEEHESLFEKLACSVKDDTVEKTASRLRSNVNITKHDDPSGLTEYIASIGDKKIGNMLVADSKYKGKVVAHSLIDPEFRGMGLGKKLYGEVMRRQPEGILHSGPVMSEDAQRVWTSLNKNKGYEIAGEAPELMGRINEKALNIPNKVKKLRPAVSAVEAKGSIFDRIKKLMGIAKRAEYKWHKSKDLHRDVTNGRHYPFSFLTGEAKELVDAIKKRDMANFKEEIGDTSYAAQMLAAQATGLNHPVYADLSKFHNREKIWKDIFKEKGSTYHPKHMEGGSNFAKPSKIIKALASAGISISQKEAEKLANKYTGGKMEKEAAAPTQQYESESIRPFGGLSGGVGLQQQSTTGNNQPALRPTLPQLRPMSTQEAPKFVNPAPGSPVGVTNTSPTMSPGAGQVISTHAPLNMNNVPLGQVNTPSFGEVYGKMKTRPKDFLLGAADITANLVSPGGSRVLRAADNIRQVANIGENFIQNKSNISKDPRALSIDNIDNIGGLVAGIPHPGAKIIGTGMQLGAKGLRLAGDYDQARAQLPDTLTEQPIVPPSNYPASNFSIRPEQQTQPNVNIDSQPMAKNSEFNRFVEYFNKTVGDKPFEYEKVASTPPPAYKSIAKLFQPAEKINFRKIYPTAPTLPPGVSNAKWRADVAENIAQHQALSNIRKNVAAHQAAFNFNVPNAAGVDELHNVWIHPEIMNTNQLGKGLAEQNRTLANLIIENTQTGKKWSQPMYRSTGTNNEATVGQWLPTRGFGAPSEDWVNAVKTKINPEFEMPVSVDAAVPQFLNPSNQGVGGLKGPGWLGKYQFDPTTQQWLVHDKGDTGKNALLPVYQRLRDALGEYMTSI